MATLHQRPFLGPVAFVKYYDKGSTRIGGDQVAAGLRQRGVDAHTVDAAGAWRDPSPILVFIKTSRLPHLLWARARGQRVVLDVQDTVVFKNRIKNRWAFDALILRSQRAATDFARPGRPDSVVHHHWDDRYRQHSAPLDRLRLGYLGEPRSLELWNRVPGLECVSESGWFERAPHFNCHLSVRRPGREWLYKPNCKVSTAAVCGAALITTRDETSLELLGSDYPFYCGEGSLAEIREAMANAEAGLGTRRWDLALERLRRVRELSSLDRELDGYHALFRRLGIGASLGSTQPKAVPPNAQA